MKESNVIEQIRVAAQDQGKVNGLTHNFYRYPARFSPSFASTAIKIFSKPGDIVLDPYMGGGTTIIEAMISGRRAIGIDLNSLAVFVAQVKTTVLSKKEIEEVILWNETYPAILSYRNKSNNLNEVIHDFHKIKNLTLPRAKFIKKIVAYAILSLHTIKSKKAKNFIRCSILKTGQWALDGRRNYTSLDEFRKKLYQNTYEMLDGLKKFQRLVYKQKPGRPRQKLFESDASKINNISFFSKSSKKVDLVITSPPYPGLHVLYHRWQVDGRRETPAPYWIADCNDGQGVSYYNFGNRNQPGLHSYFETSFNTLKAIRNVIKDGGYMVQMVAFKDPLNHLARYLENMKKAGFEEVLFEESDFIEENNRIWRKVPNRKWHASLKGNTPGSKEVILIHKAIC